MAAKDIELTQAKLKELLRYDPDAGTFTRIATTFPTAARFVGSAVPAKPHSSGYVYISVLGHPRRMHRMAWLYMTGELPSLDIDHINGDRADNRWANLRLATRAQNNANRRDARSRSGAKGVTFDPRYREPWKAQMSIENRTRVIGRFATQEQAVAAYRKAFAERHGEFARFE